MFQQKNLFGPLRNTRSTGPSSSPSSAFAAKMNAFAPPMRHSSSDLQSPAPSRATPQDEEPEEETRGEWAEALYDYSSQVGHLQSMQSQFIYPFLQEATDLEIKAHQRVLVTERTSDDWCVCCLCFRCRSLHHLHSH